MANYAGNVNGKTVHLTITDYALYSLCGENVEGYARMEQPARDVCKACLAAQDSR